MGRAGKNQGRSLPERGMPDRGCPKPTAQRRIRRNRDRRGREDGRSSNSRLDFRAHIPAPPHADPASLPWKLKPGLFSVGACHRPRGPRNDRELAAAAVARDLHRAANNSRVSCARGPSQTAPPYRQCEAVRDCEMAPTVETLGIASTGGVMYFVLLVLQFCNRQDVG
jgi:hypothetical protein